MKNETKNIIYETTEELMPNLVDLIKSTVKAAYLRGLKDGYNIKVEDENLEWKKQGHNEEKTNPLYTFGTQKGRKGK